MKLSALPNAASLTGAEILALVQTGQTRKTTAADLAALHLSSTEQRPCLTCNMK